MLSALSNRRFAAYLLAAASADSGYWISLIAQGWLVVKLTNSPFWLGLISAASQVPYLLFSLAGGALADRFDRRRVIALTNAALAAVALVTAALVVTGTITIGWLAVLGFGAGTMLALEHPVDRAWVYDLIEGRQLGRSIALSSLEWSVARTLGPAIGGVAVAFAGIAAGYVAYALAVIPMLVLALVAHTRNTAADPALDAADGGTSLSRTVVTFCVFTGLFTIGVTPYIALLPDIAKNAYGLDAAGYGALAGAGGIGAIAGALGLSLWGEVQHKGRTATVAALLGAALLFAFTRTHAVGIAIVLLAAMGCVDTLMYALGNTYVQQISGNAERGRANAIFSVAFLGGVPLGNALLGVLAGRFGTATALGWSSAAVALGALAFWFGAPHARDAA
jgi:MFS family permease